MFLSLIKTAVMSVAVLVTAFLMNTPQQEDAPSKTSIETTENIPAPPAPPTADGHDFQGDKHIHDHADEHTSPTTQPMNTSNDEPLTTTQPANPADEHPGVDPQVIMWLDKIEAAGKKLKTLEVNKMKMVVEDRINESKTIHAGSVSYVSPNGDLPAKFEIRMDVTRQEVMPGQFQRLNENTVYRFDGTWLAERKVDQRGKKFFILHQIVKPGEAFNPLELGKGPFPLPIGQNRKRVLNMFDVEIVPPPANVRTRWVHLKMTPKPHVNAQATLGFTQVEFKYDIVTLLPQEVRTEEANRKGFVTSVRTITLEEQTQDKLSEEEQQKRFSVEPPKEEGWIIQRKPLGG